MRCLVTGAAGFIGGHLVERLARDGHTVIAWARADVDITDRAGVARGLADAAPDAVFHLAAQSLPVRSWADPIGTMRTNLEGTLHLLEAVRACEGPRPRILLAGSSGQYASSRDGSPIGEEAPADPGSPYAVSKMAADACGRLYAHAHGLDVVRFRPFFWIGPRKTDDAASDIARRVVAIERGAQSRLAVGRTDTVRDLIDVSDGLSALLLLLEKGTSGEAYNICSGAGVSIGDLIASFRTLSKAPFETVLDPALLRPVDEPVRVGDATRIRALGWRPLVPLEHSVREILAYWRAQ